MERKGMEGEQAGIAIEHRWGGRIACCAHVQVSAENELSGDGRMHDVSLSGAFIETKLPLPLYSQAAIGIVNEDGSVREPAIRVTVVRTESNGVGVEWRETVEGPICPALGCTTLCLAAEKIHGPR
jgi:hypothetical protein